MERIKYQELINFLEGNVLKWDRNKIKQLEKESRNFEIKDRILYRIGSKERLLRVLKEDEVDSVIFMTHNHPTGGHFGKGATFNKINTRFWWKGMYKDIEEYIRTCDS